MLCRPIAGSRLAFCLFFALTGAFAEPAAAQSATSLDQVRQAIFGVVGKNCPRIEVQATKVQFTVTLVNCADTSSRVRDIDAGRIADAVTKSIVGADGFQAIVALHIDYVVREGNGTHQRRIDAIDFVKNPQGEFQLHMT